MVRGWRVELGLGQGSVIFLPPLHRLPDACFLSVALNCSSAGDTILCRTFEPKICLSGKTRTTIAAAGFVKVDPHIDQLLT